MDGWMEIKLVNMKIVGFYKNMVPLITMGLLSWHMTMKK